MLVKSVILTLSTIQQRQVLQHTLYGVLLSDEGASVWFPPLTFLFFLAPTPPPPVCSPPPPPPLTGELFC